MQVLGTSGKGIGKESLRNGIENEWKLDKKRGCSFRSEVATAGGTTRSVLIGLDSQAPIHSEFSRCGGRITEES